MPRPRSPCCERASSGQITAAALNNVMNSRRLIADSRGPQGIVAAQTCTGKDPAHVRFGSKADIAEHQPMSALPPIARSIAFFGMSALGQKRTWHHSLDHLVGARQQIVRNHKAERLGGLEIDNRLELGRPLNRQVARLRAPQNLVDEGSGEPEHVRKARTQSWPRSASAVFLSPAFAVQ